MKLKIYLIKVRNWRIDPEEPVDSQSKLSASVMRATVYWMVVSC